MATRPVFFTKDSSPYYVEEAVSFQFNPGFSVTQKRKNIRSIHEAFLAKHPDANPLEISSKSEIPLGVQLSAFYLPISIGEVDTTVESAFQSGKVFEYGGPFTDLLTQPSFAAKKDPRLRESGSLTEFRSNGVSFPLEPKTFFYDWLYVQALAGNAELSDAVCRFDAFTDVEFNPGKSINCQARSAAIFVSLRKTGALEDAMRNPEIFKAAVYESRPFPEAQQIKLDI